MIPKITPPSVGMISPNIVQTARNIITYLGALVRDLNNAFLSLDALIRDPETKDGIWTIVKDGNGDAVCTGAATICAKDHLTTFGDLFMKEATIILPRGLFAAAPDVIVTPDMGGGIPFFAVPLTSEDAAQYVRVGIFCAQDISAQKDFTVRLRVAGRWR